MRKSLLFAIAMLTASMAMAIPAHRGSANIVQPDGSTVTIRLHGDEYLHFNTTDDGYSVVQRPDGYYVYAYKGSDGQLHATNRVAHDADKRSASEEAWLMGVEKYLAPTMSEDIARQQQAEFSRRAQARSPQRASQYDYNNFRGLILLVQYNDLQFKRSDYASIVNDIANKENYRGFSNSGEGLYTGSVRDYFHDNSNGVFTPQFDVVGPITVNYSQYYPNGTANAGKLTLAAIEAADSLVDYSLYDGDGDQVVDMVYFIFAGVGSNISGNDSRLLWPHASAIYRQVGQRWEMVEKDSVYLGRYACSTELYGSKNWAIIDGIGVICHEFSHVLGLMDHYDTDYEGSGGQSKHPGDWDLMAGGGYQNNGRTPSGYNLYEKWAVGFDCDVQTITEEGSYELKALGTSHAGYRLNTPVRKEFFLIENRQLTTKWDRLVPGHGMLVWRVDSTNSGVWQNNKVNCNPKHNYFQVLRAGGDPQGFDSASDPFPGTKRVRALNYDTSPANLKTWAGKFPTLGIENIQERNGTITFDVLDLNILKRISLPESAIVGKGLSLQLTETRYPSMAPYTLEWSSSNTEIATIDNEGKVQGVDVGEVDITVMANGDSTLVATCHVTVEEVAICKDIAEYRTLEEDGKGALLLNDALVVYINGSNAYVRDASGSIVFAGTGLELEVGDMLNGSVFGKRTTNNRVPELQKVDQLTNADGYTVSKGHKVTPRDISVEEVSEANYGDLITLKEASLVNDGGIWAIGGDNKIRLWNTFKLQKITVPTKLVDKYFDVTGIYHTNMLKDGQVVDELALTGELKEVVPSGIAATTDKADAGTKAIIYASDGRKVAEATIGALSQLRLGHGVYVVKTDNKTWQLAR